MRLYRGFESASGFYSFDFPGFGLNCGIQDEGLQNASLPKPNQIWLLNGFCCTSGSVSCEFHCPNTIPVYVVCLILDLK